MKNLLILDLETTGLDPERDRIIEVGAVLWSAEHLSIVECYSALLPGDGNNAARFNGISPELLRDSGGDEGVAWQVILTLAERADAVVAHQADFEQKLLAEALSSGPSEDAAAAAAHLLNKPWICTVEDFEWPAPLPYRNLIAIALAHGVAVTSAHRAIQDCLLLARIFEQVLRHDDRPSPSLERALAMGQREKAEFASLAPYEQKEAVKAAGFHWDGQNWTRRMAVEDAEKLPFDVARIK